VRNLLGKINLVYLVIDIILLACATYAAFLVRLESEMQQFYPQLYRMLPIILITKVISLSLFGQYRGQGYRTSNLRIIGACITATMIMLSLVLLGVLLEGIPRSVFVLDCCFTIIFIAGYRFGIRRYQGSKFTISKRHILIYGSSALGVFWLVLCLVVEWRLYDMSGEVSNVLPSWVARYLILPAQLESFLQWMFL
jgi:FlaA1/EpsC-like NDP-sugar epimerase